MRLTRRASLGLSEPCCRHSPQGTGVAVATSAGVRSKRGGASDRAARSRSERDPRLPLTSPCSPVPLTP